MLWAWHHPCHLRAPGFHCPAGRPGTQNTRFARGVGSAQTAGQSHTFPRCVRAFMPFGCNSKHRARVTKAARGKGAKPGVSDKEQEKTPAQRRAAMAGFCSCKTGIHAIHGNNLGAAPEAHVRHRHRDLPGLRRGGADHAQSTRYARGAGSRLHRSPGGDAQSTSRGRLSGRFWFTLIGRMSRSKRACCRKGGRRLPVGLDDLTHRASSTRLLCCCAEYGWVSATLTSGASGQRRWRRRAF